MINKPENTVQLSSSIKHSLGIFFAVYYTFVVLYVKFPKKNNQASVLQLKFAKQEMKTSNTIKSNLSISKSTVAPNPRIDPYSVHDFVFDDRPQHLFHENPDNELKTCVCGEFDCQQQPAITQLFQHLQSKPNREIRPTFDFYKAQLKDPKLRIDLSKTRIDFDEKLNTVKILTFDGYGKPRRLVNDNWSVRIVSK